MYVYKVDHEYGVKLLHEASEPLKFRVVEVAREMLLNGCVERAAEIDSMLRRKHYLGDELAGGAVWANIGKLQHDGVVRNGHLRRVRERGARVLRNGDSDRFVRHRVIEGNGYASSRRWDR
ncbi:MAG: hypothetical protein JWM39_785 [Parcubacteria group bacterium]|nr:hypothetical protein [Parcubacteria group bacterium]